MIVGDSRQAGRPAMGRPIRQIAIIGGGTAGWMAAADLVRALENMDIRIILVESEDIATVGVGEATLPSIIEFIRRLGLDENEIVRETGATFKLGIGFRDWTRLGDFYFHPFGPTASGIGAVSFPSYWLRMFLQGKAARLEEYSIQAMAAAHGKFVRPAHAPNTPLNKIAYALHFDARRFADCLKTFAQKHGVTRVSGTVEQVVLDSERGFIDAVVLRDGSRIAADLFVDCTGFRALLIGQALKVGYADWSRWLPCDRAWVVHGRCTGLPAPYTLATGAQAGWRWRIPLQHRVGNGYVYSSQFADDQMALDALLASVDPEFATQPAQLHFNPGRRDKFWHKNCVSLGLASGFLEPLEATSIHLIQRGIAMLLKFFPDREFSQADIDRYNKMLTFEFERVRDFLLMHYRHTARTDEFWRHCRELPQTDTLQERIDLFRSRGRILREDSELFPIQSWLSVMVGQGIVPDGYDPLTDGIEPDKIIDRLEGIRRDVRRCVDTMPSHAAFIEKCCLSDAR
jgi:tryptophan 7-halogenase